MAYLLLRPELLASAASKAAALATTINEVSAAAAQATSEVAAAAADEVSEAIAALFAGHGQEFQAVTQQVAAYHREFVDALTATGNGYADAEAVNSAALTSNPVVTIIMAGSGTPTPSPTFVTDVVSKYLTAYAPTGTVQPLSLPAGEYPDTGVNSLTQDVSIARGATILNDAIQQQLAAGNAVNVVGYSQSANVASLVMQQLDPGGTPSSLPINFVLLGNSMNPNGGWDARFPGLSFPSIGFTTLGAAPSNSFPTTVYTFEYDGWADFPRYPINIVSDLNALAGMVTVHGGYESLTSAQLASAIVLPTQGPTTTTYYMIPTQNLPLLDPVRFIPYVGDPIADLVQPILRPIVNWGYGDPNYGWSTGPANIATPFGFLPPLDASLALGPAIVDGIPAGFTAAVNDIGAQTFSPQSLLPPLSMGLDSVGLRSGPPTISDVASGLQSASKTGLATSYAILRPTADIATAALVSLPSYDVNLFLDGFNQALNGQPVEGLVNAFGRPVAANMGLLPFLGGLELAALAVAVDPTVVGDLQV